MLPHSLRVIQNHQIRTPSNKSKQAKIRTLSLKHRFLSNPNPMRLKEIRTIKIRIRRKMKKITIMMRRREVKKKMTKMTMMMVTMTRTKYRFD